MYTSDNVESFSLYGDTLIVCLGLLGKQANAMPAHELRAAKMKPGYELATMHQEWAQNGANTVSAPSAPSPHLAKHALLAQLVGHKGALWGMQDQQFIVTSAPHDAHRPFWTDTKTLTRTSTS